MDLSICGNKKPADLRVAGAAAAFCQKSQYAGRIKAE